MQPMVRAETKTVWFAPTDPLAPTFTAVADGVGIAEPTVSSVMRTSRVNGKGSSLGRSSAAEGQAVHEAVAIGLLGGSVTQRWAGYVRGARAFLRAINSTVLAVEVPVFTVGRYGGYLDCLALSKHSRLVAIDWKTGNIHPRSAVQLCAYVQAEKRLVVERIAVTGPAEDTPWGASYPMTAAHFSMCWVVGLTADRWQAYGFAPYATPEPAAMTIFNRLFVHGEQPTRSIPLNDWWDWYLGPFDTPTATPLPNTP